MKNKFVKLFILFVSLYVFGLSSFAYIASDADIDLSVAKLQKLTSCDYSSFYNKSEMIGQRLATFDMLTNQYKNETMVIMQKLSSIKAQILSVKNSGEISDSEKRVQLLKLYQDANTAVTQIDLNTTNYLYALQPQMPTLTYRNYKKKFVDFYNGLKITNNKIVSK